MSEEKDRPEGTTHTSEGCFYKVTDHAVFYFEYGEWNLCDDADNLEGWLEELVPVA